MTLFDEDEEDDKPVDDLVKNLKEMKNFHNVHRFFYPYTTIINLK